MLEVAAREWGVAQRRVSGELYPLFLANQRRGLRTGFDAGDLSPYTPLLLGAGLYERMFERRDLPNRRSYGVSLLVDGSASMLQPREMSSRTASARGRWPPPRSAPGPSLGSPTSSRSSSRSRSSTVASWRPPVIPNERSSSGAALPPAPCGGRQGGAAERLTRTVNHYLVKSFPADGVPPRTRWPACSGWPPRRRRPPRSQRRDPDDRSTDLDVRQGSQRRRVQPRARRRATLGPQRVASHHRRARRRDDPRFGRGARRHRRPSIERGGTMVLGIGIGDETVQAAYARNQVVERPDALAAAMVDGVRSALVPVDRRRGWRHLVDPRNRTIAQLTN